ncbi:MAG: histidine phosphatase family protein, partial [Nanoarchaeota archaeon]
EGNMRDHLIGGRSNEYDITVRGKMQLIALADRLNREHVRFDAVWASPAVRTRRSAEMVCENVDYPLDRIIYDDALLEINQGEWEKKPRSEIYTPEMKARLDREQPFFRPPGGESQQDVEDRMYGFVEREILSRYDAAKTQTMAVFGHGYAFKTLIRHILGVDHRMTYKQQIDNTSITQLRYGVRGWIPMRINDAAHIEGVGRQTDTSAR